MNPFDGFDEVFGTECFCRFFFFFLSDLPANPVAPCCK
jgi:hypothetical protein